MGVRFVTVLAMTLLALAACGGGVSSAAMLAGTLQYARAGGLAGVQDRLTIQRDGHAKVSTKAGKRSFTLSMSERSRVKQFVAKADLKHINVRRHGTVTDAFGYSLRYLGRELDFDQTDVPDSARDLVSELDHLVRAHGPH